jgi:predicted small metal-binding protein
MGKMIRCECGEEVRGEDEQQVLAAAWQHIQDKHPDQAESYNDSQLRAIMEDD